MLRQKHDMLKLDVKKIDRPMLFIVPRGTFCRKTTTVGLKYQWFDLHDNGGLF